jgi:hypothetical protein
MSASINPAFGDDNRMVFGDLSFAGNMMPKGEYRKMSQEPTKSNDVKRSVYVESVPPTPHLQPSPRVVGVKTPDTMRKLSERMLKLKEMEILVNKHYRPENAKQIIMAACKQVDLEDDDSLDINLTFLRNMESQLLLTMMRRTCNGILARNTSKLY